METCTVTISIKEFDRLRKLEDDIKNLPKVQLTVYEERSGYYFMHRSEILYTTNESQREMMMMVKSKIAKLENELEGYKKYKRAQEENMKLEEVKYENLFNDCSACCNDRRAWRKLRKIFIDKFEIK